ncbi:MAG: hypothetical protein CME63_01095 [Halobacteriovoraceae bacterium]|nr:hypothetical protein [Halobacteriovoraceae bacterium]|tara:strand:+ start:168 stop:386 length:219 start_codon:yes stop_codon:yes gene_type:complete
MFSHKSELLDRVKARQKELEAKIARAKADAKGSTNKKVDEWEVKLSNMKKDISEASESTTEEISKKLNKWLQ